MPRHMRRCRGYKLNVDAITEKAKSTSKFSTLPVTAQISILYPLILEARSFGIPHSLICEAMNSAGSSVTLRYFREALSVVRAKHKKHGIKVQPSKTTEGQQGTGLARREVHPQEAASSSVPKGLTTTKDRQEKADKYMGLTNSNSLIKQLKQED